jgi:hypothetical protein
MNIHQPTPTLARLTVIAALVFMALWPAHAQEFDTYRGDKDTRPWVARCAIPHTPSDKRLEEYERCCKRWPNFPQCNGEWTKAMSLPRCAKLPHLANVRCAERILERKKKNAHSR